MTPTVPRSFLTDPGSFLVHLTGDPIPTRRAWLRLAWPSVCLAAGPAIPSLVSDTARANPPTARPTGSARPTGAARPREAARAKSVLIVFASGGQSQLDTFDPKPDAPEEIRGSFRSIPTQVPGLRFCEHLPKLAQQAHRFATIRSVTHDDLDHGSACYLALTGRFHPRKSSNPEAKPTDFPNLGAVLHRVRPNTRLPDTSIQINGPLLIPELPAIGVNGGFLGRGYDPRILGDPTDPRQVLGGLEPQPDLPPVRLRERHELRTQLDAAQARMVPHDPLAQHEQALQSLLSPATRTAYDLSQESPAVRERYGRHRAGQACLLARRLVEAGVPWITTYFSSSIRGQDTHPHLTDAYGWDTHNDIFEALSRHLLPRFDHTLSVLLEDLHDRGLLDSTLVVVMGEFGRAPRVAREPSFAGTSPGRKHWAGCYSILMAGAGIVPGAVYGASDSIAAYPSEHPVTPADIAATLMHALGVDPHGHYDDATGRPTAITTGQPLLALFR